MNTMMTGELSRNLQPLTRHCFHYYLYIEAKAGIISGKRVGFIHVHKPHERGRMKGIGLCAIFSRQGDWAFSYALKLARRYNTKLQIFHFLESPYLLRRDVVFKDASKKETVPVTPALIQEKDRELREKFDEALGDYADVGFRLCEGSDEVELRKCFRKGDYEVLVIGYNEKNASFGGNTSIEEFASGFKGPVVLVGPDSPDTFYLNHAADVVRDQLLIPRENCHKI
jgi:hypothetical protein